LLPLQVVGYVPFRPVAKSHFVPAPWVRGEPGEKDAYLPSRMTLAALAKSCNKALDPIKPYSEAQLRRMYAIGYTLLSGIWFGNNVRSYADAVSNLDLSKSPGYPYYYRCSSKREALEKFGDEIEWHVRLVLAGQEMWLPFTLTLKDELRTRDRVESEKTRAFNASGIVHHLSSECLFGVQNDKLMETLGQHPITIGIQVPGNEYVQAVLNLSDDEDCYDADGDGCDQRFNLGVARVIRDLRKAFLPPETHSAVDLLYDSVYAGDTIACGIVHRLLHNKSGWKNTGHDNSLQYFLATAESVERLSGFKYGSLEYNQVFRCLINGDDLAIKLAASIGIEKLRDDLAQYGILLELGNIVPKRARFLNFLSHHIRERCVPHFGDVTVAAGNRDKLVSSLNWVRLNSTNTFEECVVLHLLGLRICLWPWKADFDDVDERIDEYLRGISVTPSIRKLLEARISDRQFLDLHLHVEKGFNSFSLDSDCAVPEVNISRIISFYGHNAESETNCRSASCPVPAGQGAC